MLPLDPDPDPVLNSDPDPDPGGSLNPDPAGSGSGSRSGSTPLIYMINFVFVLYNMTWYKKVYAFLLLIF